MIKESEQLALIYKDLVGKDVEPNMTVTDIYTALLNDIDTKNNFLTTKYREDLHMYMITHPMYFPNYTGMRTLQTTTPTAQSVTADTNGYNIETDDMAFG